MFISDQDEAQINPNLDYMELMKEEIQLFLSDPSKTHASNEVIDRIIKKIIDISIQTNNTPVLDAWGDKRGVLIFNRDKFGRGFRIINLFTKGVEYLDHDYSTRLLLLDVHSSDDSILNCLSEEERCWLLLNCANANWWME